KRQAAKVAEAFAASLPDADHHRQLFQHVALRDSEERRTLIDGYKRVGQSRWVVHAIGELPAAQGRALMKDFALTPAGTPDKKSLREVWLYVAELGSTVPTRPIRQARETDSAVVEAVGDLVDDLKQAVDSVVDAVVNAVGAIGAALKAAIDFTK